MKRLHTVCWKPTSNARKLNFYMKPLFKIKFKKAYIKLSNLCKEKKHLSAHSDLGAV